MREPQAISVQAPGFGYVAYHGGQEQSVDVMGTGSSAVLAGLDRFGSICNISVANVNDPAQMAAAAAFVAAHGGTFPPNVFTGKHVERQDEFGNTLP